MDGKPRQYPNPAIYPYRAFISYAHDDISLVKAVIQRLTNIGFRVLWDDNLAPGAEFTQQIKSLISRSHVVFPIITSNSRLRPWVHQEIGIAVALNIPVIPIAIGTTPGEMIAAVQAITLSEQMSDFESKFEKVDFEKIVTPKPQIPFGTTIIATFPAERVKAIADYAEVFAELGEYGLVRIQAKIGGSFSVPYQDIDHIVWKKREGERGDSYLRFHSRRERLSIERHARECGLRLIIDPSSPTVNVGGDEGRKTRLEVLREFLTSISRTSVSIEIVLSSHARETNLVVVGDHFYAESMAPREGQGYLQTIVNSHGPSVLQRIKKYDELFVELSPERMRSVADVISLLNEEIRRIEAAADHG
ncbi:MAG: toll/interleukin-1 receptor domain-containing protein [Anaerolineae bacterium]|nr:toll/interleukin-1 receptor domain-containing protein [Anaerolineae bacterium]